MPDPICEHCGEPHPLTTRFCPNTGRAMSPIAAAASASAAAPLGGAAGTGPTGGPPPLGGPTPGAAETGGVPTNVDGTAEVGVYDLLQQSIALYRRHARMLLTVAGVVFVPGALAHACARAVILAPTIVVQVTTDPKTHHVTAAPVSVGTLAAGLSTILLGLLALAVTGLLLHGVIIPLVQGALALATADRLASGTATWQEIWTWLFRRLAVVLSAVIPAALLTGAGFFFLLVPGLLLAFFFSFVPLVALFEGMGGAQALRRSYELVRADWLRMLILLFVFALISWLTRALAGLFLGGLFGSQLLQDALTLLLLPIPVIGSVLLYFDGRRKREGYGSQQLADELARIRAAG